jgi:hypothetical protein
LVLKIRALISKINTHMIGLLKKASSLDAVKNINFSYLSKVIYFKLMQ